MLRTMREDQKHYLRFGYPVDGIHVVVVRIHRNEKTMEETAKRAAEQLKIPWQAIGLWLSCDAANKAQATSRARRIGTSLTKMPP